MNRRKIWHDTVQYIAKSTLLRNIFHEGNFLLEKELQDCTSVLDLGCGSNSAVQNSKHLIYSVGVDINKKSIQESKKKNIHSKYFTKEIQDLSFAKKSFDAVVILGVIEHLPKEDGAKLVKKSETWAKKKIIITTPNGFHPQKGSKDNPHQEHLSGWSPKELKDSGYHVFGITGAKWMYKKGHHVYEDSLNKYAYDNLWMHPRAFAFIINAVVELIVYYIPSHAFTLFAVKKLQ